MSVKVGKEAAKVFSKTINSPKTAFPMFANPATREKPYLKKCTSSTIMVDPLLIIRSDIPGNYGLEQQTKPKYGLHMMDLHMLMANCIWDTLKTR